jgi:hypothetical protein
MYNLLTIFSSDENISAGPGIFKKKDGLSGPDSFLNQKNSDNFGFSPLSA